MLYRSIIVTDKWQSQKWGNINQSRYYQQKIKSTWCLSVATFKMQSEMGTSSSWQVLFIFDNSRCALLKSLWSLGFLKIETSSVSACIWETCTRRVTWANTDGPCEYKMSWQCTYLTKSEFLFVCFAADQSLFFQRTALADVARAESSQLLGGSRSRLASRGSRRFYCVATLQSVCHSS